MTEESKMEIAQKIKEYQEYLNNGQHKPQWRIDEVECFIKVMNGVINGTDKEIT